MHALRVKMAICYLAIILTGILGASCKAQTSKRAVTIASEMLSVRVDSGFPRIIEYRWKANNAVMYGQEDTLSQVKINGTAYKPEVSFSRTPNTADYLMRFDAIKVLMKAQIKVTDNVVEFKITDIIENGNTLVKTIEIPNQQLVSVRSTQPGAALAAASVWSRVKPYDEFVSLSDKTVDKKPVPRTYIIINTNKLAATMYNNVLLDTHRMYYQTIDKGTYKSCGIWNPAWDYRVIDTEIVELPYARIAITGDANGDGKVDWQDGAIAYRDIMISPLGSKHVPNDVVSQIAMNFASLAQHPFLRVFDNIKKLYLYTDGLGQTVQFKGYQSEGHDSAHPDYGNHFNVSAGGKKDLNYVVNRAWRYNCRVGVHINATEAYPEAKYFSHPLVTNRKGWGWLDQSYLIDKRYDIVSGSLYHRLSELKAAVPNLSWIYVDVYFGTGWNAWKLVQKLHHCGWAVYTEFERMLERDAVWIHRSQKPAGLGINSKIIRFIRNHQQDVWLHQPLLRGSYNLGFMGWHAENNVLACIYNIFTNNLPTKYMQHFKIMRWADDNKRIDFTDNVYVADENGSINLYKDNHLIATGHYNHKKRRMVDNKIFIPWQPKQPDKVYHWNDAGGTTSWYIPTSWLGVKKVIMYQLTDVGRVFVKYIPVKNGKVTITAKAQIPYVLYKNVPSDYPEIIWGQGSIVKDPGFDSHGFQYWNRQSSNGNLNHINIKNNEKGQTYLSVAGNNGADATIWQQITGLQAGKSYAASVWVEIKGRRKVSLVVRDYGGKAVSDTIYKSDVRNDSYCDDKLGTYYQRIKVVFDVPQSYTGQTATLLLKVARGDADSSVGFDDVRVVEYKRPPQDGHFYYEDFENVDEGWGPFVFAINSDTHTHRSELHKGYTHDTIDGRFSLKTINERKGLVYRTTPGLLRLAPKTTYTISFDFLQDNDGQYSLVVRTNDGKQANEKLNAVIKGHKGRFVRTFTTGNFNDYYIGIVKNDAKRGMLVIDNLAIDLGNTSK